MIVDLCSVCNAKLAVIQDKCQFCFHELKDQVFEPGEKVHYIRDNCKDPSQYENGIVKSVPDKEKAFVVYHCGGEWDNYTDYTAALTSNVNLRKGWYNIVLKPSKN